MKKIIRIPSTSRHCTCRQVFHQLCDTLGSDVGSPECEALHAHVKECPDCTAYLASLKTTVRLYELYPTPKLTMKARKNLLKVLSQTYTPQ